MNIDTLYNAALQGDMSELESVLQSAKGQVDINQVIDCGNVNGNDTKITLLFSVIAQMRETQINYDALDLLIKYGADVNGMVSLYDGRELIEVPILAYAIVDWNDKQLLEYFLKKGADPDIAKVTTIYGNHKSVFPMIYMAIAIAGNAEMLKMLLKYGADPNAYVQLYVQDRGCYQALPPIYHALVECQSQVMCRYLFMYGASPQSTIDLGYGLARKMSFTKYIQFTYPELSGMLTNTFESAQGANAPKVAGTKKKPAPVAVDNSEIARKVQSYKNEVPQVKSLRRCYGKMSAYLFGNFGILALAFMVIGPLCYIGADPAAAGALFMCGLPMFAVAALVWLHVSQKVKKSGQVGAMPQFVLDSLLMFAKVLFIMMIVFIPLALAIGRNIEWEEKKTTSGKTVRVHKTSDGVYEDAEGNVYEERDY